MCSLVNYRCSKWKSFKFLISFFIFSDLCFSQHGIKASENGVTIDVSDSGSQELLQIPCRMEFAVFYNGLCIECLQVEETITNSIQEGSFENFTHDLVSSNSTNSTRRDYEDGLSRTLHSIQVFCPVSYVSMHRTMIQTGVKFAKSKPVKVVTVDRAPFSQILDGKYSGVMFDILAAIQDKYNFSIEITVPSDGMFGAFVGNCWNGMVGQILRKEADIGASSFSITLERSKVVDFTIAIHEEPSAILIPAPTRGNNFLILVRPFEREVWGGLFVTIFLLVPTFYILHKLSIQFSKGRLIIKLKSIIPGTSEILMFVIGSLVQESVIAPGNKTTRFLLAIWWMITLILSNTYVGFLVSFLSAPKLYNNVNSLEDLLHQSSLKWTFRKGTAHQNLFKSDESTGIFKQIGDGTDESDLVEKDSDGVVKTLSQNFAFIKEKSFLEFALGADYEEVKHCRLTLAKEEFFTVGIGYIVSKQSPILPLLNTEISNIISTGLMNKWKSMNWPDNLWCLDAASYIISTSSKTRKLNLNDLSGVSFLWACGITLALLGFLIEHLYIFIMSNFSKYKWSKFRFKLKLTFEALQEHVINFVMK